MIYKQCKGCGAVIVYAPGKNYCISCKSLHDAEQQQNRRASNRRNAAKRDRVYTKFYKSDDWETCRRKYAETMEYKCELCGDIGENVHHVEPIQSESGWKKRFDFNNLQLLCISCHNLQHDRFKSSIHNQQPTNK